MRELLGLPAADVEIEHDVGTLSALAAKIADPTVRGYVDETIKCLQVGALRAAVVFLWTGAMRTLHEAALVKGAAGVNVAIAKHDPKARAVSKVDDFAYVKDKVFLLAAFDLGLVDKGERDALQEGLDLRNRCGHPTSYKPGEKKASGFIEDIVGIVFA